MKMKATYDIVFSTWLSDDLACHGKENFENLQNEKKYL
jgi:hypothetical protein